MAQPRRINLFLYGLFMDEAALRSKGLNPINPRRASVPGMSLRIGNRATLLADPAGTAHGIVTELTHSEIDQLYSEPSVAIYRAEAVIAQPTDGAQTPALCFNLPTAPSSREANPEYAQQLRELGRKLGLPHDYIESIK